MNFLKRKPRYSSPPYQNLRARKRCQRCGRRWGLVTPTDDSTGPYRMVMCYPCWEWVKIGAAAE